MKHSDKHQTVFVKKGKSITLTASFVGSGNYRWSSRKATGRSITVTPRSSKTYTVKDALGCIKDIFDVKVAK